VSYLMSGLAHKAAAIRLAVTEYGRSGDHAIVDIGGAFGYLAAELVLDDELDVRRGTTVEFEPTYAAGALRMYRALAPLRGRLQMALGRAEHHDFAAPATVVTMMSSLLYVPREHRRTVLDRSWDALESGGLLVIYEVLRADPPMTDDAVQYTAAELDAELGRYGTVVRLGATTLQEQSAAEAGEATVFRVVAKP
jgi:predicted O-methyltransferase YrrM